MEEAEKSESSRVEKKNYKKMPVSPGDLAALHAILGFPIAAFIPFLLLKYHKSDASPFDDNSIMILSFFIATITYVAAMVTEFKLRIRDKDCPNIISNISHLSAPFASISLVMIPFPYFGWFLLAIWLGFFVKLALDSYQELYELLGGEARAFDRIWNKLLRREAKKEEINGQSSATSSTSDDSIV